MKLIRLNNSTLTTQNFDRIDEAILFKHLKDKLESHPRITWGDTIMGPSEDLYSGQLYGSAFSLIYDPDDGAYICTDSAECLDALLSYVND